MHELSIVNSLIDLCEKNARENSATKILKVEIKVGKLSGVEPHFLQTTFDTFKEKTICQDAELIIHIQELVVRCFDCLKESILGQNNFECPECKGSVEVIDGEEMYLMRLEME